MLNDYNDKQDGDDLLDKLLFVMHVICLIATLALICAAIYTQSVVFAILSLTTLGLSSYASTLLTTSVVSMIHKK